MNGTNHFILFIIAWMILFISSILYLHIYYRILLAIFLVPFFNPDSDLFFDSECHRFFFTHSLIPTTLFWICIQPALIPEYQYHILIMLWFYPWQHLIGDLKISFKKGDFNGTWRIAFFPRLRYIKKHASRVKYQSKDQMYPFKANHFRTETSLSKLNKDLEKEWDLQYLRANIFWSHVWLYANIFIGIIGGYLLWI